MQAAHASRRASALGASTSSCHQPAAALRRASRGIWRAREAELGPAWPAPHRLPRSLTAPAAAPGLHSQEPVALDVEYAHLLMDDGSSLSVAAWVCLVGPESPHPLLKTFCRHPVLQSRRQPPAPDQADTADISSGETQARPMKTLGGVRMASLQGAPSLPEVTGQVLELCRGRTLVGHGLSKDLVALGIDPRSLPHSYDTVSFREFQNKVGNSRSLGRLSEQLLGRRIHTAGQRHDPEVDARAVLDLYLRHARPKLISEFGELVAHYARELEEEMRRRGRDDEAEEGGEAGEEVQEG